MPRNATRDPNTTLNRRDDLHTIYTALSASPGKAMLRRATVSCTERLLMLLGWERAQPERARVYANPSKRPIAANSRAGSRAGSRGDFRGDFRGDYGGTDSKGADSKGAEKSSSNWEREKPTLTLRSVNPRVQALRESSWAPDAFEAANTGTV